MYQIEPSVTKTTNTAKGVVPLLGSDTEVRVTQNKGYSHLWIGIAQDNGILAEASLMPDEVDELIVMLTYFRDGHQYANR